MQQQLFEIFPRRILRSAKICTSEYHTCMCAYETLDYVATCSIRVASNHVDSKLFQAQVCLIRKVYTLSQSLSSRAIAAVNSEATKVTVLPRNVANTTSKLKRRLCGSDIEA